MFSINRFSFMLLSFASSWAAGETAIWEPGKVVSVEEVSVPARAADPSCRGLPRGATPPPSCRASNLRAEHFWRVTVDVGNKRLVVRPYRAPGLLDSLNDSGTVYVDPNLAAAASVEVALYSSKAVRLRTDQGPGILAIVDSQELISKSEAPAVAELSPPPRPPATAVVTSDSKVVLLENNDFIDLEVQEFTTQDIGDGAVLYSFHGDSSPTRIGHNPPVFLVLTEGQEAIGQDLEVSRLQVGKEIRQLAYSSTKRHSASALPVVVTQVSSTVRKVSLREPLPPGEYIVLLGDSHRGFLFQVR